MTLYSPKDGWMVGWMDVASNYMKLIIYKDFFLSVASFFQIDYSLKLLDSSSLHLDAPVEPS